MAKGILRILENPSEWFLPFGFPILVLCILTLLLQWQAGRQQARGTMFFGARVSPAFLVSAEAGSIQRRFRLRIWLVTLAVILAFVLLAARRTFDPEQPLFILILALLTGNAVVFGLAHRQTKREAVPLAEPSTRTAALSVAQDESSAWLSAVEWLGILLPIGIPVVSMAILVLRWNDAPAGYSPLIQLKRVWVSELFGVFPAAACYCLRFRARSSDWAPAPRTSRRYRTLLGSIVSSVFTVLIFDSCWRSVAPLLRAESLPDTGFYFEDSFIGFLCVCVGVLAMGLYLARHLSRESVDPMPDHCWKWGYFYYNPADPALVVPLRSGTGFSFNYARRALWVVAALVMAAALGTGLWGFV